MVLPHLRAPANTTVHQHNNQIGYIKAWCQGMMGRDHFFDPTPHIASISELQMVPDVVSTRACSSTELLFNIE